jgi:hypothetical protein
LVLRFGDFQINGLARNEGQLAIYQGGADRASNGRKHGKQAYPRTMEASSIG